MVHHYATRWSIRLGIVLFLVAQTGCPKAVRPGVTYLISIVAKGKDGKTTPQGSATRIESAVVGSEQTLNHDNHTLSLVVRKTQYGKATFDITFPDKTVHRVQVKAGEPKDIVPRGRKIGVRIEIQESH